MSTTSESVKPMHEALEGLRFAMVTTSSSSGLSTRPLTMLEEDHGVLRFLVSKDVDWVQTLPGNSQASVSFSDPKHNQYLAVEGRAVTSDDRELIERLWNPAADAYFHGKDDPAITVLEVTAESGEWWDGPSGTIGTALAMMSAAATGDQRFTGEHGPITI